jgi:hypothetical protein
MNAYLPYIVGWLLGLLAAFLHSKLLEYQQSTAGAPLRIASGRGRQDKLARLREEFGEVLIIMCANQRGTNQKVTAVTSPAVPKSNSCYSLDVAFKVS